MNIREIYNFAKKTLYPINRSLTGKGTKDTLKLIQKYFPNLRIRRFKCNTKVFDWKIPDEWNVKRAYVMNKSGDKIIDFKNNNLHLVGYSKPINTILNKRELLKNLYTIKKIPSAIPYVTSYYKKRWGFCISYNEKKKIIKHYKNNEEFRVLIDSSFNKKGFMNYGEIVLKGNSKKEILISTYICHPSMANNELSGPMVSLALVNYFKKKKLDKTIRFLFIPETIGSIAYIFKNFRKLKKNVIGGFNLSCIGDEGQHSCMFSKSGNSPSDEAIIEAYKKLKIKKYKIYSFLKRGSDERQYNSPGIDLNISSIFRTKYGEYPQYHTSLDNFDLVTPRGVMGGFNVAKNSIEILQKKIIPKNNILCEPQMGKRGLYPTLSKSSKIHPSQNYMDFLQFSNGKNSLDYIAKKIRLNINLTKKIYLKLKSKKLVN